MPMAAGATDRARSVVVPAVAVADPKGKEAVLAWYRGEFAAANAIIDALCGHLAYVSEGGGSEYEAVFGAIHRRRLNWIPVLQMQKYHPIAEVALELKKVSAEKKKNQEEEKRDHEETAGVEEEEGDHEETAVVEVEERDHEETAVVKVEERDHEETAVVEVEERDHEETAVVEVEERDHEETAGVEVEERDHEETAGVEVEEQDHEETAIVEVEERDKTAAVEVEVAEGDGDDGMEMEEKNSEVKKMNEEEENEGNICSDVKEFVEEKAHKEDEKIEKISIEINEIDGGTNVALARNEEDDSIGSEITDSGSQGVQATSAEDEICSNHGDCETRPGQMKLTKGFSAKEPVKGHKVNVVKGLKCYEDIFTQSELAKLNDFVDDLRSAAKNGELSGESFVLFNQQVKGNRREMIQLGVPIFGQIREESANNNQTSNIEPIPPLLVTVIDHLIQWQLIPEYKRPNGCLVNFFEEGEYSQPFQKPPHLEQPISTLFLSESTMAFGRSIVSDNEGNYKGPLMLSLKEGSLLVMRGNSADVARHVMCASPNKRVTITFFRVRPDYDQCQSPTTPQMANTMTLWQPGVAGACALPNGAPYGYEPMEVVPKWGILRAPVVMLAPVHPVVMSPGRSQRDGTGVFLPWAVNARKPAKHLPPRARKGRFLALPSPIETRLPDSSHEPGISV